MRHARYLAAGLTTLAMAAPAAPGPTRTADYRELPREKILYMSDVFPNHVFPSMANGYPSERIAANNATGALARVYLELDGALQ